MCMRYLDKDLPPSLCVDDVQSCNSSFFLAQAMRSPLLVLAAGDVAQTVSAESLLNLKAMQSMRFLYAGRRFFCSRARERCARCLTHATPCRVRVRPKSRGGLDPVRRSRLGIRAHGLLQLNFRVYAGRTRLHMATTRHGSNGVKPGRAAAGAA